MKIVLSDNLPFQDSPEFKELKKEIEEFNNSEEAERILEGNTNSSDEVIAGLADLLGLDPQFIKLEED